MHSEADDVLSQRLAAIEARLSQIEQRLTQVGLSEPPPAASKPSSAFAALQSPAARAEAKPPFQAHVQARTVTSKPAHDAMPKINLGATQLLGWSGATAMVLAALYLLRLGVDSGWLNPLRQLVLAAFAGGTLVFSGLWLRRLDRHYAAFLPAAGVVVLFATLYAAHLYYALIGGEAAALGVVAVALLALWLGALFASDWFALFAVLGSYTAPLFLPELRGDMAGLVIYFCVWSLAFSYYALAQQRRAVYLLAMYLALIVFSWLFEQHLSAQWQGALLFQALQFAIFLSAAALFALRSAQPMSAGDAWLHFPALLLFYALQYDLLDRHVPAFAPWIALVTAALLLVAYLAVRQRLAADSLAARGLVSAYLALVLVHAVYLNLLPEAYAPWLGLLLFALLPYLFATGEKPEGALAHWPFVWAGMAIVLFNFLRVLFDWQMDSVPASPLVLSLYPALSYFAYLQLRREAWAQPWTAVLLFIAHLSALSAAAHLIDTPALVSLAWLALASASLAAGFYTQDRRLGQSSLLLFLLAGLKIVLFDLADTESLLRVGVLLLLGVSLYVGGLVYRKLPPV